MQKGLVNVQPTLVADDQSTKLAEPCQRAFDYPSVLAQPRTAFYTSSGYPSCDGSLSQCSSAPIKIVPFVSVEFGWPLSSASAQLSRLLDRLDRINHISKSVAVMNVGNRAGYRARNSFGIDHNMVLRSRFAFICRRWTGTFSLFWPRHLLSQQKHATSLSCLHLPTCRASPGVDAPKHLLLASL